MRPVRYQAPAEDRATLIEPSLDRFPAILTGNRQLLESSSLRIDGDPLPVFRAAARREVLATARQYHRDYAEFFPELISEGALLVSGHQPEWVHPGVWIKNFVLAGLAKRHGLVPLSLIVDSDTVKSTSLRVPIVPDRSPWDPAAVHLTPIPFDRYNGEVPYENRQIEEEDTFSNFARMIEPMAQSWGYRPLLLDVWPEVLRFSKLSRNLGTISALTRRCWERRWGCANLELPLSRLCQTIAFQRFARHLLADLPRFHATYNAVVQAYRQKHRIRSKNHPVPDLDRHGDQLEAPFWIYRPGQTQRGRLYLTPGESLPGEMQLRSRALTTTLFARLCVGDAFIHGIGGGIYDELTDALMREWLTLEPPGFLVVSGTLRLPIPCFPSTREMAQRAKRAYRDCFWNPQRHFAPEVRANPYVGSLCQQKENLIANEPRDRTARKAWFQALQQVTAELRKYIKPELQHTAEAEKRIRAEWIANQRLQRRDFSWLLFPEEHLRGWLTKQLTVG